MAGTVSPTSSNLASELLLNKIMNGSVKTSTGQTVTAAGRSIAQSLSGEAYKARSAEANMAYGYGLVEAAQSQASNMKSQLLKLKESLTGISQNDQAKAADFAVVAEQAKTIGNNIDSAQTNAKYNGQSLFSTAGVSLTAGDGITVQVALGKALSTGIGSLKAFAFTNKAGAAQALTKVNTAIQSLIQKEASYSASMVDLQNRQLLLANDGANLDTASAAQGLVGMSGAGNLLSSMLGNTDA